ncbi:hypothetical protein [Paludisphaera soli]|uniref:hypothetical protein n=1 Tax=Paludisphaera soli TaxID=2712865 RepID=UPI0013ED3B8F|nr:hypothetical protein [Paludisphaera soli]
MRRRKGRYLILEDDGRITLAVADFDEADRLAESTGLEHEDGYFDLGPVDDCLIASYRRYAGLAREFLADWLMLGRTWDADQADRRRPETYTVPCYTGGL